MPKQRNIGSRPLLSVEDAAVLLGETRSTLYRAIKAGTLPLPVFQIGARMRIPRKAVEQLLPIGTQEPRTCPMCSAARWSSALKASV